MRSLLDRLGVSGCAGRLRNWLNGSETYPAWYLLKAKSLRLWRSARAKARTGRRVVLATSTGDYGHATTFDALLGVALTLRGARVEYLLCDGVLPACSVAEWGSLPSPRVYAEEGPQRLCVRCVDAGQRRYHRVGLPVRRFSEFLCDGDFREAAQFAKGVSEAEATAAAVNGTVIGEQALAGALRFFARGDLKGETEGLPVLRRYLRAAYLANRAGQRAFAGAVPAAVVLHHGIYVPQGIMCAAAREAGSRVVTWAPAYRSGTFLLSEGDTYHHTMPSEPVQSWEALPWTAALEETTVNYLRQRWQGAGDWIRYLDGSEESRERIEHELGIDLHRPTVGLLTNVAWDARLFYESAAFPDVATWVVETIRHFARRPDLQLLIRVHPAEVRGTIQSRQPIVREIKQAFPVLPPNVYVIEPESKVNTYAAMEACDAVLVYGTKTGLELAAKGIPIVVAGEAWYRGKGFTVDVLSREEYASVLDSLPFGRRMEESSVKRARMYAFHFFFRRMIPLRNVATVEGRTLFRIRVDDLAELLPGRDPGLDVICDGILEGSGFVYPAEVWG